MSNVCVFGGGGFLGSHVAEELVTQGHNVRVFDLPASPKYSGDYEYVSGDILDFDAVSAAVRGTDVVYNFAALADLNAALTRPLDTVRLNILGNAHILEACRLNQTKRLIYASTVYVKSRQGGFYRCSKSAAEQYVLEYRKTFGLDYTILRYGSLYGPRSDRTNGLYRIVRQALETGVVSYDGAEHAMREYIHVRDAARASVAAMEAQHANQTLVLTGQEQMRVADVLEMVAEIMGVGTSVQFSNSEAPGHYVRTPYAFDDEIGRKYISPTHVDLGQGLVQLMDLISEEIQAGTKI